MPLVEIQYLMTEIGVVFEKACPEPVGRTLILPVFIATVGAAEE